MISPETRHAIRAELQEQQIKDTPAPNERQPREAGERALERAAQEWAYDIHEPPKETHTHAILTRYISGPEGLGWEWVKEYKNRRFAWCGAFAAYVWSESVSASIRRRAWASTYRLWEWARGTPRQLTLSEARAGDVVVVGKSKAWGDHITILASIESGPEGLILHTIEGNAHGELACGRQGEGVIKRTRSAQEIAYIYRPLEVDR